MGAMTDSRTRFLDALARIDAVNADDPALELVDGKPEPKELVYGRRMSAVLDRLVPDASEPLRLAVRAQHVGRFRVPRGRYPEGKVGYLEWRRDQGRMHAEIAGSILREVGYDEATIDRVQFLLQKKALRTDAETQTLEDCACLVFLEHHFLEFAATQPEEKVIDIVRKTWGKMSERGHAAALALPLGDDAKRLVGKALAP